MGQLPGCLRTVELSLRLQNPVEYRPRLTRVAAKPKHSRCSDNDYDDDVDGDKNNDDDDDVDGDENNDDVDDDEINDDDDDVDGDKNNDDDDDDEYLSNKDDEGHENDNCSRSCSMLECPEECGTDGEGRRV